MYEDSLREARKIVNYQTKWKTKLVKIEKKAEVKQASKSRINWILLLVGWILGLFTIIGLNRFTK
jgi:hypothetical protein